VAEAFGPRWALLGGGLSCLLATVVLAGYLSRSRQVGSAQLRDRLRGWRSTSG
jgi:hypothetical protein